MKSIEKYGVRQTSSADNELAYLAEELRLQGFTTLSANLLESELNELSAAFDRAGNSYAAHAAANGYDLDQLNERDIIRALPIVSPEFWTLVFNDRLQQLLKSMLGDYFILNQVNGLINRANNSKYAQSAYHRDLPYQHFVSTRPIAINALFAIDDFTLENGATRVIPASHHREDFPADETVRRMERQIPVPRGTYIVLDCMVYHAGSANRSPRDRRAVNHLFTIPMLRQQLHLPSMIVDADSFDQEQRQIIGFGLEEYRSVDDWLSARASR